MQTSRSLTFEGEDLVAEERRARLARLGGAVLAVWDSTDDAVEVGRNDHLGRGFIDVRVRSGVGVDTATLVTNRQHSGAIQSGSR